jgi:hypothetical protein
LTIISSDENSLKKQKHEKHSKIGIKALISLAIIEFLENWSLFVAHFFTHLLIVCLKGFFEYAL